MLCVDEHKKEDLPCVVSMKPGINLSEACDCLVEFAGTSIVLFKSDVTTACNSVLETMT